MAKYQLIIDDQVADLYPGEDSIPSITYSISDIADIEKRGSPTTNTIRLPGTNNNRKIFKYADNPDVKNFKGQKETFTGLLQESGTDILSGIVNLKNVIRTNNKIEFEITIIGNSGDWVATMKEEDLKGVDLGGEHEKNKTNIDASLDGTEVYAYGLVDFGYTGPQIEIDSVEDNNGKAKLIFAGNNTVWNLRTNFHAGETIYGLRFDISAYNTSFTITTIGESSMTVSAAYMGDSKGIIRMEGGSVVVEERPLMLSVYEIFNKIFELAGYQVQSVFTETTFFKRLWMLPGKEKYPEGFADDNYAKVGRLTNYTNASFTTVFPFPFNVVTEDESSHFTTITRFTTTEAMLVTFKASFKLKQTGQETTQAYCFFEVNGTINTQMNRKEVRVDLDGGEDYTTLVQEAELRLEAGDYVEVGLNTTPYYPCSLTVSVDDTYLEATVSDKIVKGSWIVPGDHLPDIKQLDFVRAIRHLFNLYFLTDVNMKKVYIEPRDSFYETTETIDLTEKLDVSRPLTFEELGADINKKLTFKYKDDSIDWGLAEQSRIQGWDYCQYKAELTNKFSPDEEKKIENPVFAATLMKPFDTIGINQTLLPRIWQEPPEGETIPDWLEEYVPRILYYASEKTCETGESWTFEEVLQASIPVFCSYDVDTVNTNSLMFDNRSRERELYSKHYANYVRTLNESRKITGYFKITAADIQRLICPGPTEIKDFRSLVYFRHLGAIANCRLESISECKAGQGKTSKVVLITDNDNTFEQVLPQVWTEEFTNVLTAGAHKNGVVIKIGVGWDYVHDAATGILTTPYVGTGQLPYGIGSASSNYAMENFRIERGFLYFDTSSLPDSCTITEAYLDVWKIAGDTSQEIEVFQGTQGDTLSGADYHHFGAVSFGKSTSAGLGLRRILLNDAGRTSISKTGWTKFCLRDQNFDVLDTSPHYNYSTFKTYFTNAPAAYIIKLVVTYMG